MKKVIYIFVLFYTLNLLAQNNQIIKNTDGVSLPNKVDYCSGERFSLKVDATATTTGDYTIKRVDPQSYQLQAGTSLIPFDNSVNVNNDKFSESISIGFPFSFYGKEYTKVSVGIHGRLVFNDNEVDNLKNRNQYKDRTYTGAVNSQMRQTLPSTSYNKISLNDLNAETPLSQIFFGYTDLATTGNVNTTRTYRSGVFGGVKGLLISFQNAIFQDYSQNFNSSVLLLEDGRIVIFVDGKRRANVNAIIGIQNETASKYRVPQHSTNASDYNNGNWVSEGVAFLFEPSQKLTPKIEWIVGTNVIGTDTNLTYQPSGSSEVLKVKITYFDENNTQIGNAQESEVEFLKIQKPQIQVTAPTRCGDPAELKVLNYNPHLVYEWFSANGTTILGTGQTLNATTTGHYQVRVKKDSSADFCESSDAVEVVISSPIPPIVAASKHFCEQNGTASKIVNLLDIINYSLNPSLYTVKFYENGIEVSDYQNFEILPNTIRNIKVVVEPLAGVAPADCKKEEAFTINYTSLPEEDTEYQSDLICQGSTRYTLSDLKMKYPELNAYNVLFLVSGNEKTEVNPAENPNIKIKINKENCSYEYAFKFKFHQNILANVPTTVLPAACSSNPVFDFSVLKSEINPDASVQISFHKTLSDAQNGVNALSVNDVFPVGSSQVFVRVIDNNTGCVATTYSSFEVKVFEKPKLKITNIQVPKKCEGEVFDLKQKYTDLLVSLEPLVTNYVITYYSETGLELSENQYTNYDPNVYGFRPYLILSYDGLCQDKIEFQIQYQDLPKSLVNTISICDEVTYSLNEFKKQVVPNPEDYIFTDENNVELSSDINLSLLNFKYYLINKNTNCKSELQTVQFQKVSPLSINTPSDYALCDTEGDRFDGKTTFDLTQKQNEISTLSSLIFTYYQDQARTQKIENPEKYIANTNSQTIYVKVESNGYCPSYTEIQLVVKSPTKSTTLLQKYEICYGEKIEVDAGRENILFSWNDGTTQQKKIFDKAGKYSVTLTNADGCSYEHHFEISDENQPKIEQINQYDDKIEVIASGKYPIEYSFDGRTYSTNNILLNPTSPEYTVRVRSILPNGNYCEGETKALYTILIPNAITPNGDGINDVWEIKNIEKMEQLEVIIVDRYGKTVFQTDDKNFIWDGKVQGRPLPTGTYWYILKWFDPTQNKNQIRQGWVLLKNR